MEFTSYECEIAPDEGFTEDKDIFRRKSFATSLTGILEKSSRSLSLMIDARWGEGKTTFLRMWSGELRKEGFPVIYFDAFKTDYCSDPFEALAASIADFISDNLPKQKKLRNEIIEYSASRLKILSRVGIRLSAQSIVHHLIGNEAASTLKEMEGEFAAAADKGVDSFWKEEIETFAQESKNIEKLRVAISSITEKYSTDQKPLIFIIDELDRCRPDYAIALLERIKHFMVTEKVHYVHAVNNHQLAASASAIYGSGIDADAYFQKFFDFKFSLPTINGSAYYKSASAVYAHRLFERSAEKFEFLRQYHDVYNTLAKLAEKIHPPLRTLERVNDQLILSYSKNIRNHSFMHAILVSSMLFKHCDSALYNKLLKQTLQFDEVESFFNSKYVSNAEYDDEAEHVVSYTLCCWGKCLLEEIPESDQRMRDAASMLHIQNFKKFPTITAQTYIEQFNLQ